MSHAGGLCSYGRLDLWKLKTLFLQRLLPVKDKTWLRVNQYQMMPGTKDASGFKSKKGS